MVCILEHGEENPNCVVDLYLIIPVTVEHGIEGEVCFPFEIQNLINFSVSAFCRKKHAEIGRWNSTALVSRENRR